jgi:hypothetical protein
MSRERAREHHQRFKYSLMKRALDEPKKFLDACMCSSPDDVLDTVWRMLAADIPADEQVQNDGLTVCLHQDGIVLVRMPRVERMNEAYFVAAVPAPKADGALAYRMFALERGEDDAFIAEWDGHVKKHYGSADDASAESLLSAISEILAGTRHSNVSTPVRLASERPPGDEQQQR